MPVRIATHTDVDKVVSLIAKSEEAQKHYPGFLERKDDSQEVHKRIVKDKLQDTNCAYFLAEEREKPVGLVSATIYNWEATKEERFGTLEMLFVEEEQRVKDVSKELVNAASKWFVNQGVYVLDVNVFNDNIPAQKFWDKMGFKSIVTLKYIDLRREK